MRLLHGLSLSATVLSFLNTCCVAGQKPDYKVTRFVRYGESRNLDEPAPEERSTTLVAVYDIADDFEGDESELAEALGDAAAVFEPSYNELVQDFGSDIVVDTVDVLTIEESSESPTVAPETLPPVPETPAPVPETAAPVPETAPPVPGTAPPTPMPQSAPSNPGPNPTPEVPPTPEPTEPPVTDPTEPPVTDPTEPPVFFLTPRPSEPPVTDPTEPPVTDPTEPPVFFLIPTEAPRDDENPPFIPGGPPTPGLPPGFPPPIPGGSPTPGLLGGNRTLYERRLFFARLNLQISYTCRFCQSDTGLYNQVRRALQGDDVADLPSITQGLAAYSAAVRALNDPVVLDVVALEEIVIDDGKGSKKSKGSKRSKKEKTGKSKSKGM